MLLQKGSNSTMAMKFGMPSLGHTMETGKLIEWLRKEGDAISKGEPLLVVETDKVTTEVESPTDGVLVKVLAKPDEERLIGATLAILATAGETVDEAEIDRLLEAEIAAPQASMPDPVRPSAASLPRAQHPRVRVKISPVARKLTAELGVDPTTVAGTGPRGRITKEDILAAAPYATAAASTTPKISGPEVSSTVPLAGIRGRVADRMLQSWNTIPQVTLTMEVDMSATVAFRESMLEQWKQGFQARISLGHLITRAVAVALERHPRLNATLGEGSVNLHASINVGMAVNLDEGLVVPVILDAGNKDLGKIARESLELTEKAQTGRLGLDEISDATFTITNLGGADVDLFTPIISPPQVAILGVGRIQPRPMVVEEELTIRPTAHLCLVFDHRALDGVPAGRFLQELRQLFATPQEFA